MPGEQLLLNWSPDGTDLVFTTRGGTTEPRYTPDGKWIIFSAVAPSSRSLWVVPAEGGEPIAMVRGGIYTHGVWQP